MRLETPTETSDTPKALVEAANFQRKKGVWHQVQFAVTATQIRTKFAVHVYLQHMCIFADKHIYFR